MVRWLLLALLVGSCSAPPREGALPARRSVPLRTVIFSGHRYVAPVDVDGATGLPLMVHGNSRMYLSLTHKVAGRLNGGPVRKTEDYGYSSRGKGVIRVERIRVGGQAYPGDPKVPVFDFTENEESPFQGMLGVRFLVAARAAVDFTRDRLLLGVARQPEPDPSLLADGYRRIPIATTADGRTTVPVRFPALGRTLPITPSTVSTALTLHLPLFRGHVPMVQGAPDRSPNATTPAEFHADRVAFEIAGVAMADSASFEDLAEYGKVAASDLESYGYLGYDWMKEHRAVLDYANARLYFKP